MKNTYNPSQELLIKSYEQFKVFFKSGKKFTFMVYYQGRMVQKIICPKRRQGPAETYQLKKQ